MRHGNWGGNRVRARYDPRMATPYAPERRPLSIDVNDDEEVRGWLAQLLAEQVMTRREPVPAIHLLKDDHEEVLDLTALRQADPEADIAATWAAVCARRDVERRILVLRLEPGDGNAELTKKIGLDLDLSSSGMGVRTKRFSMYVVDGVVKQLFVEAPGKFEVSSAEHMLKHLS